MADFLHKHPDFHPALPACFTDDDAAAPDPRRRRRSDLHDEAETSAAARRQSRILSRWVARQAEDMIISNIERRNRESELLALAGLHTVSMLDASFLRAAADTSAPAVERPPSARASSLLQRWRQLEDESAAPAPAPPDRRESSADGAEESDDAHSERERVQRIVRGWTAESARSESPRGEWLGERERERVRLVREWVQTASQQRDTRAVLSEETRTEQLPRLRGRQARVDLITRIAAERQRELQRLSEHRVVSEFSHRNRIQSLLRGRFLRNGRPLEDERLPSVAFRELGQLRQHHPVSGLREGFRYRLENIVRGQANGHSDAPASHNVNDSTTDHSQASTIVEESNDDHAQFQSRNVNTEFHQMTETHTTAGLDVSSTNNTDWQESVTQRENWREEDADNGRIGWQHSPEVEFSEWRNGNEEESDRNWNENTDQEWAEEVPEDGEDSHILEAHEEWRGDESHETVENWHDGPLSSQRGQQSTPNRSVNRFVPPEDDNVYSMELRELLSRRSVSNLLHSQFRESLDQLIQSYVQRQDRAPLDWEIQRTVVDPDSPDEDQSLQRDDLNQDQQEPNTRPPLVMSTPPVPPPQPLWHSEFHRNNWTRPSLHRSEIEWDISDLRADISRLQQGMNHMQRMLEACMDMQLELQRSVRQEVSAALNRSVGEQGAGEEIWEDGSKWAHVKKGTCCVCCDSHIDALLYRCGHMCTCLKCANELVRSGDKCPLCRAPIAEVVRAYSIL